MILTAIFYRDLLTWTVEVMLTTNPSVVTVNGDSVPFDQYGDRVRFSLISSSSDLIVTFDSEDNPIKFTSDDEEEVFKGVINAVSEKIGGVDYLYIPACDRYKLQVNVYDAFGTRLTVQNETSSPFWEVSKSIHLKEYFGELIPCWEVSVSGSYLESAETETWSSLSSIPHKVVVSNVNFVMTSKIMKSRLVDKLKGDYYGDFN